MFTLARRLAAAVLIGVVVFGAVRPANARYYRYPNPHFRYWRHGFYHGPYGGWGGDPYGGYFTGAANLVNAQGRYLVNSQQAYLTKEKVRAAQLDNRRRAFDEFLYEKSRTPTLNEVRVREQHEELIRALTNPPDTEIWSGKSLNDLLTDIQARHIRGWQGPSVPLNPNTLREINLTVRGVGNVGPFKAVGNLNWPFGLQILAPAEQTRELREEIGSLMSLGKKQAADRGRIDPGILVALNSDIDQMRNLLVSRVGEYSMNDYMQAKGYLRQLDQAVKILKQPDAGNYLNGRYQARGRTAAELTQYMTENGLRFAPAIAGEESAYSGLFQSLGGLHQMYTAGDNAPMNPLC